MAHVRRELPSGVAYYVDADGRPMEVYVPEVMRASLGADAFDTAILDEVEAHAGWGRIGYAEGSWGWSSRHRGLFRGLGRGREGDNGRHLRLIPPATE
jgi:hypothetical protein